MPGKRGYTHSSRSNISYANAGMRAVKRARRSLVFTGSARRPKSQLAKLKQSILRGHELKCFIQNTTQNGDLLYIDNWQRGLMTSNLYYLPVGDSRWNRDGGQVFCERIRLKGFIKWNQVENQNSMLNQLRVRMLVVEGPFDNLSVTGAATGEPTGLFLDGGITNALGNNQKVANTVIDHRNYRLLHDTWLRKDPSDSSAITTAEEGGTGQTHFRPEFIIPFDIDIAIKKKLVYDETSAYKVTGPAGPKTLSLLVGTVRGDATNGATGADCKLNVTSYLYFRDT